MHFLKSLNWVDILMAVLAVRILYISSKTGFVTEFMKTLAVLISVFVAFHYYVRWADVMAGATGMTTAALQPFFHVLGFVVIWLVAVIVMKFVRDGILVIFTVQTISMVDKWGAVVISVLRFFLTASMIMFVFLVTDQPYMERMTMSSFSHKYILSVAPQTYQKMVNGFVVKFFPSQKVNQVVTEELRETGKI